MKTILFAIILTISSFGTATSAVPARDVTLRIRQEKAVAGTPLWIKFVSVVEDSRCPAGVNCVWAGNAKVRIQVSDRRNRTRTFDINTNVGNKSALFRGYEIQLVSLTPKPGENRKMMASRNMAVFSVQRTGR